MERTEIKPCPLCGTKLTLKDVEVDHDPNEWYMVNISCPNEKCGVEVKLDSDNMQDCFSMVLIEKWNRRK